MPLEPDLAAQVATRWPGARIVEAVPLAGDASSRRYLRCHLAGPPPCPATVVTMLLADRGLALSSEELGTLPETPGELPYLNVQRFLHRIGIRVPAIYAADVEAGLLLLEDIGDLSLWKAVSGASAPEVARAYRRATATLVHLQAQGTRRRDSRCIAFAQRFDERLFAWELDHFRRYGLEAGCGVVLSGADAERFTRDCTRLAAALAEEPTVFSHRDFHSWNLFCHGDEIVVLDFQDALLAPPAYDLASLLTDRETPCRVGPALEEELISYYLTAARDLLPLPDSPAAFRQSYRRCTLHRALKVIGRFHYLEQEKGKLGYVAMLGPTIRLARNLLSELDDFPDLAEIVSGSLPAAETRGPAGRE